MKPAHLLLALPLAFAGLLPANSQAPPPEEGTDVEQFQRDLPLIEALVNESLAIAGETDPLNRAQSSHRLADQFAREMHNAAVKKSNHRATCMGRHLEDLLLRGVANNLSLAKKQLPKDSPRRAELDRLGEQAAQAAKRFDADMSRFADPKDMSRTLEAIKKARTEVQDAVKGKSKYFEKTHFSKGKKGKGGRPR
jgi:hypothetical protein